MAYRMIYYTQYIVSDELHPPQMRFTPVYTELDQLSNSVVDLIAQNKLDEAEAVSRRLLAGYPDQIDGLDRLAQVYEARDEKETKLRTIAKRSILLDRCQDLISKGSIGIYPRLIGSNQKSKAIVIK